MCCKFFKRGLSLGYHSYRMVIWEFIRKILHMFHRCFRFFLGKINFHWQPLRKLAHFTVMEELITFMKNVWYSCQFNSLQVQLASDVPKPDATPFPEGHAVHSVNLLSAVLQWSAGQFRQPVDWSRCFPASHGSTSIKSSFKFWLQQVLTRNKQFSKPVIPLDVIVCKM